MRAAKWISIELAFRFMPIQGAVCHRTANTCLAFSRDLAKTCVSSATMNLDRRHSSIRTSPENPTLPPRAGWDEPMIRVPWSMQTRVYTASRGYVS